MPVIRSSVPVLDASGNPAVGRIVRAYRADTGALIGSTVTSDGAVGDSNYSNVVLLMRMEGVDGSTMFVDESPTPKSLTASGPSIQVEQSFDGLSSMQLFGSGYVQVGSHPEMAIGLQPFTIEARIRPSAGHLGVIFSQYDASATGPTFYVYQDKLQAFYANGSGAMSGSITFDPLAWPHVALERDATGTATLYQDGTPVASANWSGVDLGSPAWSKIGAYLSNSAPFSGYIDDLRITKGVARYGGAFTPPLTLPLSGDAPPLGQYVISTSYTGEVYVVCLDDTAGTVYNHQILRTTPV